MRVHIVVAALLLASGLPAAARGIDAVAPSDHYALTAWTTERGLPPGDVLAMAQDVEGYLWLGTSTGLVRFDGFQFELWGSHGEAPLPERAIPALVAARDGSLWVGFGNAGGVGRIRGGQMVTYSEKDGLPSGPAETLIEDRHGVIWAGGRGGLARFRENRWELIGRDQGFTGAEVHSLFEDRTGALWVGAAGGVYRRSGEVFALVDPGATYVQSIAETGDGTIWVTDSHQIVRKLHARDVPDHASTVQMPAAGWRLLYDRRGQLWVAALGGGLLRLRTRGRDANSLIERFSYENKIAGSPRSLFEDRENNVWVGMRGGGLLRLSNSVVTADVQLEGVTNDGVRALSVDRSGNVWVATGHSVNRFSGSHRDVDVLPQALSLHADDHGTMWAATPQGVGSFRDGQFHLLPMPGWVRWERITSMTTTSSGDLWICSLDQGLMRWRGGQLVPFGDGAELATKSCTVAFTDRRGRVWVGFSAGGVALYDQGVVRAYGRSDGLPGGNIAMISEDKSGAVWVSSARGVSRFRNERFVTLTADNGPFDNIVASLIQDDDGYMWVGVNSGSGIVRFSPQEMDKVTVNSSYQVEYTSYDVSDGLQGDLHWSSRPAAVRGGDGRLWFATGAGVAVIDPHILPASRRPTVTRIDTVSVDGRTLLPARRLVLPSGTSTLEIHYAALALSAASKLRFRYMVEGLNPDWVTAGSRRQVSYSSLPSGRYRFRVSATTDGVWTEPAVWDFSVAPPLYKTTGFFEMCVLGMALALGLTWWSRVRSMRHQFALVFAERARMSRELHDTLLQSLGAIGVELEAIAIQLDSSQRTAIDELRRLRRQVAHSVRDARESILELRSDRMERPGVADRLREWTSALRPGGPTEVDVAVTGHPQRYSTDIEEQLFRIAQEAIGNALRHAAARRIHVSVDCQPDVVAVRVSDDGCGFVPGDCDPYTGEHWGLVTMKERAARVGGQLTITSSPNQGTIVATIVPVVSTE